MWLIRIYSLKKDSFSFVVLHIIFILDRFFFLLGFKSISKKYVRAG